MGVFKKYPSIENLHRVPQIFDLPAVVVTEKIHGMNVRFGLVDGRFRVGNRNEEFYFETSAPNTCMDFVGWMRETNLPREIERLAQSLGVEIIFYGEWHGSGIQRGVKYTEGKSLRVFDIRIAEKFVSWDEVVRLADMIGVKTAPLFYRGTPSQEIFDNVRVKPSVVAFENGVGTDQNFSEGVVIKPVQMHRDCRGNWVMAKHKNPQWEERKSLSDGRVKPQIPNGALAFVEEFFTPQRLEHVLTQLRESGLTITRENPIGPIILKMYQDVLKESGEEFTNLPEDTQKAINNIHTQKTVGLFVAYLNQTEST